MRHGRWTDARFGSKADIGLPAIDVRYSPKSGHPKWPASLHLPRLRFFRRLSPFPFASLPVVAGDTALDHFVAPTVACGTTVDRALVAVWCRSRLVRWP
jgi:hypothetical protein